MSKAHHTPGPWTVYEETDCIGSNVFRKLVISTPRCEAYDGGRAIAEVHEMTSETPMEADARLIAAAPEMLKALEYLVEHGAANGPRSNGLHRSSGIMQKAHAAIAAARGESASLAA